MFAQNGRGFTRDLFKLFSGLRYCFRYNCRNLLDTNVSIKGFVPPDSAAKITDIFKSNNSKDDLCEQATINVKYLKLVFNTKLWDY